MKSELILGLPEYQITDLEETRGRVRIAARYVGEVSCPQCKGTSLRYKDRRIRELRHESWGQRQTVLALESRKWHCLGCGRYFWQRMPGILPCKRATEPFRRAVFLTEGFHTQMEVLQRQAYGFRNFNSYRLRVKIMCS